MGAIRRAYCGVTTNGINDEELPGWRYPHCGGQAPTVEHPAEPSERWAPFFLNGYVVWPLSDVTRDIVEFQFWQGHDVTCRSR